MISPHAPDVRILANESELVEVVVDLTISRILHQLKVSGVFHLALTGGSLGIRISEDLVAIWNEEPEKFSGLHLWWGDDRFVPEMSDQRNALPVLQGLSDDSLIHIHQILPADSHVDVEISARRYNADLFGIDMDLTLLGLGPDGHVASLFPGVWNEHEERNAIAVIASPKPPPQRVSFSMAKINSSRSTWFIVSGAEKHEAVAKIIARDGSIPASHVRAQEETLLFVDHRAAASE